MRIPIGPPSNSPAPKSAWKLSLSPVSLRIAWEFLAAGAPVTGMLNELSGGRIWQPGASGGGEPIAIAAAPSAIVPTTAMTPALRMPFPAARRLLSTRS